MLAKLSIVFYIIAIFLYFINGQIALFALSIVLLIVTAGLGLYMSYYNVSPQLREYRETVYQMESDGASDEEILEFMNQDTEVDESKLIDAPLWMNIVVMLGAIASFILLVMGIMDRI